LLQLKQRRNLTADQFAYFIGKKYDRLKKAHGGAREASSQNENLKTEAKLVLDHGISRATVHRAAEFSRNVDAIADAVGEISS
jgi:hypothetical protein